MDVGHLGKQEPQEYRNTVKTGTLGLQCTGEIGHPQIQELRTTIWNLYENRSQGTQDFWESRNSGNIMPWEYKNAGKIVSLNIERITLQKEYTVGSLCYQCKRKRKIQSESLALQTLTFVNTSKRISGDIRTLNRSAQYIVEHCITQEPYTGYCLTLLSVPRGMDSTRCLETFL